MRGEHDREILRLAIPAFGALIAEPLYVLTDTAIVGHIGTDELGGVAVATAVLLTIHAMMIFLAYGTTATVARRLGAGDDSGAASSGCTSAVGSRPPSGCFWRPSERSWLRRWWTGSAPMLRSGHTPSPTSASACWGSPRCCWSWPEPAISEVCKTRVLRW